MLECHDYVKEDDGSNAPDSTYTTYCVLPKGHKGICMGPLSFKKFAGREQRIKDKIKGIIRCLNVQQVDTATINIFEAIKDEL